MLLGQAGGLVIDWTQMPTYNTIMSIAAGGALLSLAYFARDLKTDPDLHLEISQMHRGGEHGVHLPF